MWRFQDLAWFTSCQFLVSAMVCQEAADSKLVAFSIALRNGVGQSRGEGRLSTSVGGPPWPGVCSSYSVAIPKA